VKIKILGEKYGKILWNRRFSRRSECKFDSRPAHKAGCFLGWYLWSVKESERG